MPTLTETGCRDRQRRLHEHLAEFNVDAVVIDDYREIYYFTGALLQPWPACLVVYADGKCWLAAHTCDATPIVDDCLTYESHTYSTNNPDNMRLLNALVAKRLSGSRKMHRVGWQAESLHKLLATTFEQRLDLDEWAVFDDIFAEMEARKDPDEIEMIRRSIRADLAAYTAVQCAIKPGANELDVLAMGQRAAMLDACESVYHGGDYRSGALGGPARDRKIESGELYTVDAQTVYRGYWCDLSRTYIVGEVATDLQKSIHEHIAAIQRDVAAMLKPGLHGTSLWQMLDQRIREHPAFSVTGYIHHAGHGVGLRAHEAPDLNRDREGILQPGNVLSVEPGGYTDDARVGARLENMYLITDTGAVNLSEYPLNLVPVAC
jgi:Xaa-Pro dipeptidase